MSPILVTELQKMYKAKRNKKKIYSNFYNLL